MRTFISKQPNLMKHFTSLIFNDILLKKLLKNPYLLNKLTILVIITKLILLSTTYQFIQTSINNRHSAAITEF